MAALSTLLPGRRSRLSLAVGRWRLTVVESERVPGGVRPVRCGRRPLDPPAAPGQWPDLADALEEALGRAAGRPSETVDVALLRPLAFARIQRVPPVDGGDVLRLLVENHARYVPVEGSAVVDVQVLDGGDGGEREVLACAAQASLLEAVSGALADAGLRPGTVTAGPVAELAALTARCSGLDAGRCAVLLASGELPEVAVLRDGTVRRFCPLPPVATGEGAIDDGAALARALAPDEAGEPPEALHVPDHGSASILPAGTARSGSVPRRKRLELPTPLGDLDAAAVAALGVGHAPSGSPSLLTPDQRARRAAAARRRTGWTAAVAAVLLLAAAALHVWGARRHLAAVRDVRRSLRTAVDRAVKVKRGARRLTSILSTLERAHDSRIRWSRVLATLAERLPEEAHVTGLAREGERIIVSGRSGARPDSLAAALERGDAVAKATVMAETDAGEASAPRGGFRLALETARSRGARAPGPADEASDPGSGHRAPIPAAAAEVAPRRATAAARTAPPPGASPPPTGAGPEGRERRGRSTRAAGGEDR